MIRGQLTWRGVTFGIGTPIELVSIDGLDDLPDADVLTVLHPRSAGGDPGDIIPQVRVLSVTMEIVAADTAAPRKLLRDTTGYTQDGVAEELVLLVDDVETLLKARLTKRSLPLDSEYISHNQAVIQWECVDPRRYGEAFSVQIPLPIAGAGQPYPFDYPAPYVTVPGEPGARTVTNTGSYPTPPIYRIDGPVPQPIIDLIGADGGIRTLSVDLDLASGEYLILDAGTGDVLLNGTADRSTALSGTVLAEMTLAKGPTTVRFRSPGYDPAARLTVTGHSAEM